jgi:hypothetical protein
MSKTKARRQLEAWINDGRENWLASKELRAQWAREKDIRAWLQAVEMRGRRGQVDKHTLNEARMLLEGRKYNGGKWLTLDVYDREQDDAVDTEVTIPHKDIGGTDE